MVYEDSSKQFDGGTMNKDCPNCGEEIEIEEEKIAGKDRPVIQYPCDNCGWDPEAQLADIDTSNVRKYSDLDRL